VAEPENPEEEALKEGAVPPGSQTQLETLTVSESADPADSVDDTVTGSSAEPAADAGSEVQENLEARAIAAAQEALASGAEALRNAEVEAAKLLAEAEALQVRRPAGKSKTTEKLLVGFIVLNLALMGLMLIIPGRSEVVGPGPGTGPIKGSSPGEKLTVEPIPLTTGPDPFVAPLDEPQEMLPQLEHYNAGQLAVAKGDYARAVELFEAYLKAHPNLQPFQQRIVYGSLVYCLRKLGRRNEAQAYDTRMDSLREIASLPEDLLDSARRAERAGRGVDMRRYYARFLLQQNQVGPAMRMRSVIAEAYMKIGDSYRIDAETGAEKSEEAERLLLERLHRQKKAEK
jgi:tetratricopeptide (TPR) repeat protein